MKKPIIGIIILIIIVLIFIPKQKKEEVIIVKLTPTITKTIKPSKQIEPTKAIIKKTILTSTPTPTIINQSQTVIYKEIKPTPTIYNYPTPTTFYIYIPPTNYPTNTPQPTPTSVPTPELNCSYVADGIRTINQEMARRGITSDSEFSQQQIAAYCATIQYCPCP